MNTQAEWADVLITVWAFVAVMTLWPELAPRPDGTFVFPPPDHLAFKLEMLVNVPVSLLAAYVCARMARRRDGAEFDAAKPMWAHLGTAVGLLVGCGAGTRLWLRQKASRDARRGSIDSAPEPRASS